MGGPQLARLGACEALMCWGDTWLGQIFPRSFPSLNSSWETWLGCKEEYLECFSTVLVGSGPLKRVVLRPDRYFVPLVLSALFLPLPPHLACAFFHSSSCPHLYSSAPFLFLHPVSAESQRLKSTREKQVGYLSSDCPNDRVGPLRFSAGLCSGLAPPPVKTGDDSGPSCHLSSTSRLVMAVSRQRSYPSNGIFSPGPGWSQWLFIVQLQINQQLHFRLLKRCKVCVCGASRQMNKHRDTNLSA